jgi:PPP family 3-phenylpropionic acid transporter
MLWFLLMVFLLMVPHRMNDALLTLHLKDALAADDSMISWAWGVATVSEALTFGLLGRYLMKFHEIALLAAVSFLYTVRWLLYGLVEDPIAVISMQASHSVTFAVFWLVSVNYVNRIVPEEFRATGQALLSAVFLGIAGMVGGTAGGWVRDQWGSDMMYLWGSLFALVAGMLFTITRMDQRRKGK